MNSWSSGVFFDSIGELDVTDYSGVSGQSLEACHFLLAALRIDLDTIASRSNTRLPMSLMDMGVISDYSRLELTRLPGHVPPGLVSGAGSRGVRARHPHGVALHKPASPDHGP